MNKFPDFQSLDELVAFWEKHDAADYADDFEEVGSEAMPGVRRRVLEIELDDELFAELDSLAKKLGKTSDRLAREWVQERISTGNG